MCGGRGTCVVPTGLAYKSAATLPGAKALRPTLNMQASRLGFSTVSEEKGGRPIYGQALAAAAAGLGDGRPSRQAPYLQPTHINTWQVMGSNN